MAQILVINSSNTASGKTLLAAHLAVMLSRDYKVAVADSLKSESPLATFIAKRYNLNLTKNYNLPVPQYHSLHKDTLNDISSCYDIIILDSPDSEYFKYADIFLTPLRGSEGLNSLSLKNSLYASLIWEAKKQRAALGKNAFRWVVCPNDNYSSEQLRLLEQNSRFLGFSISPALGHREEYNNGLKQGLTVLDKDQPELKTLFDLPDLYARRNLKKIAEFVWQNK